jgi:acyl-[acyl-carrier-protein]-phospholipid O-acyltransferase / long-chain-fatty-acid--[acyl-carrier-protein] ligase
MTTKPVVARLFQSRLTAQVVAVYLRVRFRFTIKGQHYLTEALTHAQADQRGILLAGNHTGLLDTLLVTVAYPQPVTFIMREEVVEWRGVGGLVKKANTLILWQDQMTRQLRACIDRLKTGEHFVIFPEGELTKTGELGTFNDGVGLLWEKGQAVLLPFAIHGGHEAWREGAWHATGVPVTLEFLPPVVHSNDPTETKTLRKALPNQLKQVIHSALTVNAL